MCGVGVGGECVRCGCGRGVGAGRVSRRKHLTVMRVNRREDGVRRWRVGWCMLRVGSRGRSVCAVACPCSCVSVLCVWVDEYVVLVSLSLSLFLTVSVSALFLTVSVSVSAPARCGSVMHRLVPGPLTHGSRCSLCNIGGCPPPVRELGGSSCALVHTTCTYTCLRWPSFTCACT